METPPRCPHLFVRKRELTVVIGSLSVPVQVCVVGLCRCTSLSLGPCADAVQGAPGHNRWRVAETPLPAKSQGRTGDSSL